MFGTLTVHEAKGDAGHLILDANHRVIALCSHYADAVDLAAAWNEKHPPIAAEPVAAGVTIKMTPEQWEQFDLRR